MTTPITPAELEAAARALIRAERSSLGIEVTMPVVYPTGQLVNVVVTFEDGNYLVHDAGFGAMCLTESGLRMTKQLTQRLAELARHYGCDFVSGRMSRRATPDQLAIAMVMVANASRTVGDQSLEIRRHAEGDFRSAVAERLRSVVGDRVRSNEQVTGASGRKYQMGNVVLDQKLSKPIAFVAALSSRSLVPVHFAEFYDLKDRYEGVERDSVFDENAGFRTEDWNLLGPVARLVPFSRASQEFARMMQ